MNGWLGDDCRASKNKKSNLFKYLYINVFLGSCGPHGPICYNAGICIPSANSTFTCQCEHPWSGPTCEER